MHMLQQLARDQRKTVITSIHQPNSALFFSFDRLIMLAEGNVVYFGSPRDSLTYLRQKNHDSLPSLACPDGYNAADHWMDLLVQDTAIEEHRVLVQALNSKPTASSDPSNTGQDNGGDIELQPVQPEEASLMPHKAMSTRDQLIWAWDDDVIADQMDLAIDDRDDDDATTKMMGGYTDTSKYNTSWGYQYRTLVHRSLKNSRSAIFTPINLIKSAALGIVSGALWFQMEYTEKNVFDISSFFFFTMTYVTVATCFPCVWLCSSPSQLCIGRHLQILGI
jgi:ABC-2 type transporter